MHKLTAVYWIKNEARYLPEWMEFHLMQGFDHFIFYDNGSTDRLHETIRPYLDDGLAEVRIYPSNLQGAKNYWAMSHCIDEQKGKTKWLHFHAVDEFTYCPDKRKVTELLEEFDEYDGLAVAWLLYNSSGHIERPRGLVTRNYTERVNFDRCLHVKTIIKPANTRAPAPSTHWFHHSGRGAVDENYNYITGAFNNGPLGKPFHEPVYLEQCPAHYSTNKIRNNHYVTRSQQEWEEKMGKGLLDSQEEDKRRADADHQWNFLNGLGYHARPTDTQGAWHPGFFNDTSALTFHDELVERLKYRYRFNLEILQALELV